MLKRIWQQVVRWFRRLFGMETSPQPFSKRGGSKISASAAGGQKGVEPPPELTDADLEFMFTQLLEGVHQGRGQEWALKYLQRVENRVTTERWLTWLRRFGEKLLASPVPNNELAARLVQLGEVGCKEIGEGAYDIGMQLLIRNPGEPIWEYDGPDVEPVTFPIQEEVENPQEGELETITLDELFVRLQQDADLRQLLAQQLEIETTDPSAIIQELINRFNAEGQPDTDEA